MDTDLKTVKPYVREAGSGQTVLCLHSSVSSSKQWEPLIELLSGQFLVKAADLYGYGKTPDWPGRGVLTLHDEVQLLAPIVETIDDPFHLVGHSYGGAVALSIALAWPERIRSLTVYEPVLFSLLFDSVPTRPGSDEIWRVQAEVRRCVLMGRLEQAGQLFVDYWSGEGAWESFPDWRREALAERMPKVVADFDAVLSNMLTITDYKAVPAKTMILYGERSPVSSRQVASMLCDAIEHAHCRSFMKLGHMGPVTDPDEVNTAIADFLRSC